MGELGATVMVYPPGWVTMPVGIFALTDRGAIFDGAAPHHAVVATTLIVLTAAVAHFEPAPRRAADWPGGARYCTASSASAAPWPTPTHIVARP
ncbi:MAG: hypothetical protein WDM84_03095 [Bauldia sp.]